MSAAWLPEGVPVRKRAFDLVLTLPGTLVISPLLLLLALVVWLVHGRPILFKQKRPGYRGKPFELYKFRTMRDLHGPDGELLPDESRITAVGRWLRSLSLDELPELFNVLRGEMSLVGPRPLLMEYLSRYSREQARRHDVLPGITGWAQVNGRNAVSWQEKFQLDLWYVDNWSLWLDVKILAMTLWKVLTREGISQPGHATAELFMGNDPDQDAPND